MCLPQLARRDPRPCRMWGFGRSCFRSRRSRLMRVYRVEGGGMREGRDTCRMRLVPDFLDLAPHASLVNVPRGQMIPKTVPTHRIHVLLSHTRPRTTITQAHLRPSRWRTHLLCLRCPQNRQSLKPNPAPPSSMAPSSHNLTNRQCRSYRRPCQQR